MNQIYCTMILPCEVLENIFSFLDGRTFCICREVSKYWNEIIKGMQINNNIWKQFCLKEISRNVLEEILWYKSVSSSVIDWKGVYKKWFQSKLILTASFWKRKSNGFLPNPITCIAVSGSWILTGHNNGHLCIWNLETGELNKTLVCHLRTINDMALVDLLNLETYDGLETYNWAHHHLLTISKDHYIRVTSLLELPTLSSDGLYPSSHGDCLIQVKVFNDNFAVSCYDNTVSLWKMEVLKTPYFCLNISLVKKIIGPEDVIFSIGLWSCELQCISHGGKLKHLGPDQSSWLEKKYFKKSYSEEGQEQIVRVIFASMFRSKTVIMLTGDGKLIVSIGDQKIRHYYPMKHLRTSVVCIALYATILALGCENGKIFLYYISSEEQLIDLNLSSPTISFLLSEASIISIYVSLQDDSPVVAASTTTSIYVIKWYKPVNNFVKPKHIL